MRMGLNPQVHDLKKSAEMQRLKKSRNRNEEMQQHRNSKEHGQRQEWRQRDGERYRERVLVASTRLEAIGSSNQSLVSAIESLADFGRSNNISLVPQPFPSRCVDSGLCFLDRRFETKTMGDRAKKAPWVCPVCKIEMNAAPYGPVSYTHLTLPTNREV